MTQVFNEIQEECASIEANKERIKRTARLVRRDDREIDPGILEVLTRMRKRLLPPVLKRRGKEAKEAHDKALEKYRTYINRLIKVLILVEQKYVHAIKRINTENELTPISLMRFNAIMSGGVTPRQAKDGTWYTAPLNYNYDMEVKAIIGMFFKQVYRGSSEYGCSQWVAHDKPTLNDSAIRLLTALSDQPKFKNLFKMFIEKIDDVIVLDCAITESGATEKFIQLLNTVFDA